MRGSATHCFAYYCRQGNSGGDVLRIRSESGMRGLRRPPALVYQGSSMPFRRKCAASLCDVFATTVFLFSTCLCLLRNSLYVQMSDSAKKRTYSDGAAAGRLALSSVTISGPIITPRLPAIPVIPRLGRSPRFSWYGNQQPR